MLSPGNFCLHSPDTQPTIDLAGDRYTLLASGAQTGGAYAAFLAVVPPGGGPPPHVHHREDEMFYVLEGEITFFTGEQELVGRAGDLIHAPRDVPHRFQNTGHVPGKMLFLALPAGLENYFWKCGWEVQDRSAPIAPPNAEQIQQLIALAPEYGLEVLAPKH